MSTHEQQGENEKPVSDEPQVSSANNPKAAYAVGYGRPPVHTRFKPGQSGNPKGCPAGRANAKTTVERLINEKVPVREGEKTRHMTKLEAMLQAHTMKAMKGDARSASIVIGVVARMGLLRDQEEETLAAMPQEDTAILDDFLRRNAGSSNSADRPEEG
jgi:Family of unknown function (DUF5681)